MANNPNIGLEAVVESLKADLKGLRDLVDDRRQSDKEAVLAALAAAEKAVNAALASAEKATLKFDTSLTEYKAMANEWRRTVEGLVVQLREVSELRAELRSISDRVADLRESRSRVLGSDQRMAIDKVDTAKWIGWIIAAITFGWAVFNSNK